MHLFPPRFFSLLSLSSHVFSAPYLPSSHPAPLVLRWWWSKGWPCQSICQRLTVLQHMHYTDGYHHSRNDCPPPPPRRCHTHTEIKRQEESARGSERIEETDVKADELLCCAVRGYNVSRHRLWNCLVFFSFFCVYIFTGFWTQR